MYRRRKGGRIGMRYLVKGREERPRKRKLSPSSLMIGPPEEKRRKCASSHLNGRRSIPKEGEGT